MSEHRLDLQRGESRDSSAHCQGDCLPGQDIPQGGLRGGRGRKGVGTLHSCPARDQGHPSLWTTTPHNLTDITADLPGRLHLIPVNTVL